MESIIFRRRSIREYHKKPVPEEYYTRLVSAGMSAPSARNKRPWHFIVVDDREILDQIVAVHPYAGMLNEAPLAILVAGDKMLEDNIGYLVENCSAATQNILLHATELGLGSVWLGVYPREKRMKGLANVLHLPGHIIPISLIAIGYPAEEKPPNEGIEEEKIHFNRYK